MESPAGDSNIMGSSGPDRPLSHGSRLPEMLLCRPVRWHQTLCGSLPAHVLQQGSAREGLKEGGGSGFPQGPASRQFLHRTSSGPSQHTPSWLGLYLKSKSRESRRRIVPGIWNQLVGERWESEPQGGAPVGTDGSHSPLARVMPWAPRCP